MSKKNRKNNNVVRVNPFEQYLMDTYGDFVNDAYVEFLQMQETSAIYDGISAIRSEIEQREVVAIARQKEAQKKANKAAADASAKAADIRAKAAKKAARDEKVATVRSKAIAVAIYSVPIMLALASLALR